MSRQARYGPRDLAADPSVSSRECERKRIPFGAMLLGAIGIADLAATLLALAAS